MAQVYATIDELRGRIGKEIYEQLYGSASDAGEAAAADLEAAAGEVDAYLGRRYVVPVVTVRAGLAKDLALTLAEERAWARASDNELPASVTRRVDHARDMLGKFAAGTLRLYGEAEQSGVVAIAGDPPLMTREGLKGY
ncbi:MAG: phage protein Gp36 family protein [Victivallaceae bacterium]|nr:phage protein Gp36 family protein [Victivallaceae bacterium]